MIRAETSTRPPRRRMSNLLNQLDSFNFDDEQEPQKQPPSPPARGESSRNSHKSRISAESPTRPSRTSSDAVNIRTRNTDNNSPSPRTRMSAETNATTLTVRSNSISNDSSNYLVAAQNLVDIIQAKPARRRRLKSTTEPNQAQIQANVQESILEADQYKILESSEIESLKNQLKSNISKAGSFKPDPSNLGVLVEIATSVIQIERQLLQHTCAVLRYEVVNNFDEKISSDSIALESKIKEHEKTISVLQSKLEKDVQKSPQLSKQEIRRSKSTADPTAAEYNRLKLDIATMRAELAQVKEDFAEERDKADQMALNYEEAQSTIERLQSELDQVNTLNENDGSRTLRRRAADGARGENDQSAQLQEELRREREMTRVLQEKLDALIRQSKSLSTSKSNDGSDTETEDEDSRPRQRGNRRPRTEPEETQQLSPEMTKKMEEFQSVSDGIALLQQEITNSSRRAPLDIVEFSTIVRNLLADKEELFKKVQQSSSISDQIERLTVQVANLKSDNERAAALHKEELAKRDISTREEVSKLEKSITDIKKAHKDQLAKQEASLKDEVDKLSKTVSERDKQIESISKQHKSETTALKQRLTKTEDSLTKISTERDSLLSEKKALEDSVARITAALTKSQQNCDNQVKEIAQLNIKVREGEVKVQQMADAMEEAMGFSEPASKAATGDRDLSAEVDRLQLTIVKLKTENVSLLESQDNEQHQNELLQIETANLKKQLEKLTLNLKELAAEHESYEATIKSLQEDLKRRGSGGDVPATPEPVVEEKSKGGYFW